MSSSRRAGWLPGALGMASMSMDAPPSGPASLQELKRRWIDRLEERAPRGRSWTWALKQAWNHGAGSGFGRDGHARASLFQFKLMLAKTGDAFKPDEASRLFNHWAATTATDPDGPLSGSLSIDTVLADLQNALTPDRAIFGLRGAVLDGYPTPGSRSRSNVESSDSSLVVIGAPSVAAAARAEPSVNRRDMALLPCAGGEATVGTTVNNASSVEGGIFGDQFLAAQAALPVASAGNVSNQPSLSGGIFEDHSRDLPSLARGPPPRSQRPSVPGGIFAPSHDRPGTVEYGYERFPRQGLDTLGAQHMKLGM